jgi:hypothetical protein
MKSDEGFAKVAGVELTLLDCARYFHDAGGINGVAQIAKDIGGRANVRTLADAAEGSVQLFGLPFSGLA